MIKNLGFTLIELMIVVAIISILAGIAIPAYQSYAKDAVAKACLSEVKSYANTVFYDLNDQDTKTTPKKPIISACTAITDASTWDETTTNLVIEAKSKNSATTNIMCDLSKGANCTVVP